MGRAPVRLHVHPRAVWLLPLLLQVLGGAALADGNGAGQGTPPPAGAAFRRIAPDTFAVTLAERFGVTHPEQPVEIAFSGGPLDPAATRMIGPDGREVPFQQLANGNILIRTRLPGSLRSQTYYFWRYPDWDPPTRLTIDLPFASWPTVDGTPIMLQALQLPAVMTSPPFLFLKQVEGSGGAKLELHRGPDLVDPIEMPANQWIAGYLKTSGWIVDPRDAAGGTLYTAGHSFLTGDPVRLTATGALPAPLHPDTTYYVIPLTNQTFQLAASLADALGGTAVQLLDAGDGVFEAQVAWTWRLEAAAPSGVIPGNAVQVVDGGSCLEITNGLTGVRVVKTEGNLIPFNKAPIQAVQFADGSWNGFGTNCLYPAPQTGAPRTSTDPLGFARGYQLNVLESGPLAVRLQASYTLDRPEMSSGAWVPIVAVDVAKDTLTVAHGTYDPVIYYWVPGRRLSVAFHAAGGTLPGGFQENTLYWPVFNSYDPVQDRVTLQLSETDGGPPVDITAAGAGSPYLIETQLVPGPGSFTETITLFAGQKSILVEDESDCPVEYFLNFRVPGAFEPDLARYRPHLVHNIDCGWELQDGLRVPYSGRSSAVDVFIDVDGSREKDANDCWCNDSKFACLPLWNMPNSGQNTGWYWLFYDDQAEADAPLIGFYEGRPSRLYRVVNTGPGMYTSPAHFAAGGAPAAGVDMTFHFRGHDLSSTQRTRREWGLYVSTKTDLRPPDQIQPVAPERNSLTGLNLTHLVADALEFPDPPGGWPAPYMERGAYDRLIEQIQSFQISPHWMLNEFARMWIGWECPSPPGPCAGSVDDVEYLLSRVEQMVLLWQNILVNGNGPFDPWWTGYQPGLEIMYMVPRILAILDYPAATPAQRERAKAAAAWLGCIYWDNDYVPLDIDTGDGLGNANQAVQLYEYRSTTSLAFPSNPQMASHLEQAVEYAENGLNYLEPSSGAPHGSCHYNTAGMDSVVSSFLLMKNLGVSMADYPQWLGYGDWMLDALSPPDPRFGGTRKIVSVGDGATKGIAMLGIVAALVREIDPVRAARLQWGWASQFDEVNAAVKVHEQAPVPSVLVIDEEAPQSPPPYDSRHYEGYWSVLHSGAHTPYETGAWFVNGNWYSDHRHDDSGQVSLYAHTAPLATDWNAHWWNPHTPGGYMHDRVNLAADLGQAWDADAPLLTAGTPYWTWPEQGAARFAGFTCSSQSAADLGTAAGFRWTRLVRLMAPDPALPVVLVTDAFAGPGAADSKVLTWNLWADGKVETPGGDYTPIERFNTTQSGDVNAYPSNGPVFPLDSGLQRFHFTGRAWPAHETGGIDWDLYLLPDGGQEFLLGNWGHNSIFGNETGEFQAANGTAPYERQHILRVRGTGAFTTLILPYRKGERPAGLAANQDGSDFVIGWAGQSLRFDGHFSWYRAAGDPATRREVFTAYDATGGSAGGMGASDGPLEIVRDGDTVTLTADGEAGTRAFTLPGWWTLPEGVTRSGPDRYVLLFPGSGRLVVTMPARPPVVPAAPADLRATLVADHAAAELSWTNPASDALGFQIERRVDRGNWAEIATTGAGVTTWEDTELEVGHAYTYRVRAWNLDGLSAPSNEAEVDIFHHSGSFTMGGYLGVGTSGPERAAHIRGPNAVFRMDRSADTAAFMITRTDDAGATLKSFVVGVNASGAGLGSFVLNDLGTATGGGGVNRLTVDNAGTAAFGGTVRASGFFTPSGRALKTDIRPLDGALDVLLGLRGVRFYWRGPDPSSCGGGPGGGAGAGSGGGPAGKGIPVIGFIAEEVGAVIPEAVSWAPSGSGTFGLDYGRLTAPLIAELVEGLKRQQREIEKLQERREYLKLLLEELRRLGEQVPAPGGK